MSRLPRESEEVKAIHDKILAKSLELIAKHGFRSLTMRELAREAGMTAANIYNYFASKDEIFLHIVIRGYALLAADLELAMNSAASPLARARGMMLAFMKFGVERWDFYEVMFVSAAPHAAEFAGTPLEKLAAEEHEHSLAVLATVYATMEELSAGKPSEAEKSLLVTEIWSLLHGWITLYHRQILGYIAPEPERQAEALVDDIIGRFGRS